MEKNEKPIPFEKAYPGYPIKKVPKTAYIPGVLGGLFALALLVSVTLGLFFVLSKVKVPVPQAKVAAVPKTEDEMMKSLPVEKLYEIAVNCMTVKDGDCAKKVFSHIMKVSPDFIEKNGRRRKMMSEASTL